MQSPLHCMQAIVPHHMHHNAEPEAVDLLLEVDSIALLNEHVDEANCDRTCRYLTAVASYLPVPDDVAAFTAAYDAYVKIGKLHDAMRVALCMGDRDRMEEVFVACTDSLDKQQLGYLLARQGVMLDCEEGRCAIEDESLREKVRPLQRAMNGKPAAAPCRVYATCARGTSAQRWLQVVDIMSNTRLSERYLALARDLDVLEPKIPEDVYKMHLVDTHRGGLAPALDSAAKNLSATLVNALVNLGFGNDKMVTPATQEGERSWVSRNKDQGKTCAVASIGVRC